jgi:hypothetical protein
MALVTVTRSGFDAEGVRGTGDDERSSLLCSFIGPPSLEQSSTCPFPKRRTGINAEPVGYDGGQSSCISPAISIEFQRTSPGKKNDELLGKFF